MNSINNRFIILIITLILATIIEARGGRGGGGRSGGGGYRSGGGSSSSRSSGSGGFWGSIFGGSKSSSKPSSSHSSSSSDSKPRTYPYYQHTANYGNSYGSRPPKESGSVDHMDSYMMGNMFSHYPETSKSLRDKFSNIYSRKQMSDISDNAYIPPRLFVIANNLPESMTTVATPTARQLSVSEMLDVVNELKTPFNSNESLESFLDKMAKIDFSTLWATTHSTPTTSEMPKSSTELPSSTMESNVMNSQLISTFLQKQSTTDSNDKDVEATTTAKQLSVSEMFDVVNELKTPFNSNESLESFLDKIAKIDFSTLLATGYTPETRTTTPSTPTTSERPNSSTDFPSSTMESNVMNSPLISTFLQKQSTTDSNDKDVDPQLSIVSPPITSIAEKVPASMIQKQLTSNSKGNDMDPLQSITSPSIISAVDAVPATTESTQAVNLDISTPYGLICLPVIYNEVNEFGINVNIERLACYPALEPAAPL